MRYVVPEDAHDFIREGWKRELPNINVQLRFAGPGRWVTYEDVDDYLLITGRSTIGGAPPEDRLCWPVHMTFVEELEAALGLLAGQQLAVDPGAPLCPVEIHVVKYDYGAAATKTHRKYDARVAGPASRFRVVLSRLFSWRRWGRRRWV